MTDINYLQQCGTGCLTENPATRTPLSRQIYEHFQTITSQLWQLNVHDILPAAGGTQVIVFTRSASDPDLNAIATLLLPFTPELIVSRENAMQHIRFL